MFGLKKWIPYLTIFCFLFSAQDAVSQRKLIRGVILDAQSGERVPFASMRFLKSGNGKLSDSAGNFAFRFEEWPKDTLEISYVGFQDYDLRISDTLTRKSRNDSLFVVIQLQRGAYINEVVVSRKVDFGWVLWKKIVLSTKFNDRYRFANFSYELYNKLELDLNKINKNKIEKVKLLRPFDFVLNNIDSSEDHPFLPIYVTETLSDYEEH